MTTSPMLENVHTTMDVQEAVRGAARALPVGSGSKPALVKTTPDVTRLDMRGLAGIVEYEPAEYTITALAGTPIRDLSAALQENRQFLPFDPVFVQSGATVGGTVASGLSGPGRYRYGGLRDFILGTRFVDGQGRLVRGGGKVVKNAAGFDFPKLLVGSLGRLGVMVDATFKVFPRPPEFVTLFSTYEDVDSALATAKTLGVSPMELMALDLIPDPSGDQCALVTRIGGAQDLMPARVDRAAKVLANCEILDGSDDAEYWSGVAEFTWTDSAASLVKIPLTPSVIPAVDRAIAEISTARRYTVAGNVLWAAAGGSTETIDSLLAEKALAGLVLRGDSSHPLIGADNASVFAEGVRAALDPQGKFLPLHKG